MAHDLLTELKLVTEREEVELFKQYTIDINGEVFDTEDFERSNGVVVTHDLDLSVTTLNRLPSNLTVLGDLNISGTKIRIIPENTIVENDLIAMDLDHLELPEVLEVFNTLVIENVGQVFFPLRFRTTGSMEIMNSLIKDRPKMMEIAGDLTTNADSNGLLNNETIIRGILELFDDTSTILPTGMLVASINDFSGDASDYPSYNFNIT